jgi:hypothetical protein
LTTTVTPGIPLLSSSDITLPEMVAVWEKAMWLKAIKTNSRSILARMLRIEFGQPEFKKAKDIYLLYQNFQNLLFLKTFELIGGMDYNPFGPAPSDIAGSIDFHNRIDSFQSRVPSAGSYTF